MTAFRSNPVVLAVIATLETANLIVGDGEAPRDREVGWQGKAAASNFVGYCVVHQFSRGFDGSIDDPYDDGMPVVSINSFGANAKQARGIGDKAHSALLDTPITITGRSVMWVEPIADDASTDALHDVEPPMWQDVQRFRIATTTT